MIKVSPGYLRRGEPVKKHTHRLPHWQQSDCSYFITWRLADSVPFQLMRGWTRRKNAWLREHPKPWDAETELKYHLIFSREIEDWLDQGMGRCVLKDQALAALVEAVLREKLLPETHLHAYVIMPNHVHVLTRIFGEITLDNTIKTWKGASARNVNLRMGQSGRLWQQGYWDRMIRDGQHFSRCKRYILANPRKAKLAGGSYRLYVE